MVGHSPRLHSKPVLAASQSFSSFLFLLMPQPEVSQAAALDFLEKDILKRILQSKYRMQPQLLNCSLFTYTSRSFCFLLIKHIFRNNLISVYLKNTEAALRLLDFTIIENSIS